MNRLAVLGASGHGKVVADTAECCGWKIVEFFDDTWPERRRNGAWDVVGDTAALLANLDLYDGVIVAIGNNRIRQVKLAQLKAMGARLISLLHPNCTFSRYASLGEGSVVFAAAVVNADAIVGMGAILNTGCSVDHDCRLGDCVHISPGARLAGGVSVQDLSWVGIGASVRQLVNIGAQVMIGAGAAVIKDVPDSVIVAGVPARIMGPGV
ncbi:UDP-perosamine 4-acetyltransferase [Pseudomonas sp. LAMO17WK12:I10]|uniref:acetyltransferase n=1 Tax=unclassified Pseudomonas TaxID=196821 RepID=UPI000BCE3919|nr:MULTISPECIES: acetyltransferase [unclassified Pseudomonas]PXX62878.1 sugar O-acyltransferase (sialic acid O-acetyltransferase NeuD family) [Pseudomonas sp. LAMO17WK12:I9]SNY41840.1 UDP-perosamine 4-acetyltransferase [Pseudomonas sp. LAMO17WK12:I10]